MRAASKGTSSEPVSAGRQDGVAGRGRRGSLRKALDQYMGLLAHNGGEPAIHAKAAELLVKLNRRDEAAEQFIAAAACYARQGFDERELAVYQAAAARLPQHLVFWEKIAGWQRARGLGTAALATLSEARLAFARRSQRPEAIRLLRLRLELDPGDLPAAMDLADLLVRTGERGEARRLYEDLAKRTTGNDLRRARRALFFLAPTPAAAWRWARAATFAR